MKQVLFVVRAAPYGSAAIAESVRSCLGFATMPFELSYLLMDDAAWALLPNQRPQGIGGTPVLSIIANLAESDVRLCVDADSLRERGLTTEGVEPRFEALSQAEVADLVGAADAVLTY